MTAEPVESITIEVYRTPPSYSKGKFDNIGYLRAWSDKADVTLPCSLELIDDLKMKDSYIAGKLLLFHRMEAEGMTDEQKREAYLGEQATRLSISLPTVDLGVTGPFKLSVQAGKLWIEPAEPAWGGDAWLEGLTPDEAEELAEAIGFGARRAQEQATQ